MIERTPWAAMLALAAAMRVAPHRFWRLGLKEWRALVAPQPAATLYLMTFERLAARFPDKGPI